MSYVLAIDQGTTSTRAIVFDKNLQIVASSQKEIEQFFPFPGWVEHDLEEIYATVIATVRDAVEGAKISCLLYTSPSPRDTDLSRMPSSA